MKRLCETTSESNAALDRAAVLLRAVAPLDPSDLRKSRVRAAIRSERRFSRSWRLSPVAAGIALALGGGAFAAWVAKTGNGEAKKETRAQSIEAQRDVAPTSIDNFDFIASIELESPPPPTKAEAPAVVKRTPRKTRTARPRESESALVANAFKTLRDAKDGRRAITLVEKHIARFPSGALGEEALLIGIEAATAIGDDKSLRRFAESYLARFPEGRWAARVRALGKESPRD